jgi:2,5-furandicarboxylate decarboxylase 1
MILQLRDYITKLEKAKELIHITEEVAVKFELAAALRYITEGRNKAIIFDKVKGYNVPVMGNLFGSRKRAALALGVTENKLLETFVSRGEKPVKPRMVTYSLAQEVVIDKDIDILKTIPVLTHHEKDVGPYMTSAIVVAKDPETGLRGMGVHRVQIRGKDTLRICLATPPISHFLTKAERLNKPFDVAIISGVPPAIFFAAIYVIRRFRSSPIEIDKFDIAGGFAQCPIELVKCQSVDIEVPKDAEFILEGQIIPNRRERDGPFGESSGYYIASESPVAEIKTITHRTKPLYHALVPFCLEEEALIDIMILPSLMTQIQNSLPTIRIKRLNLMALGQVNIVQIDKGTEKDASIIIDYLFSNPFTKIVIVTDGDLNISKPNEIAWAVSTRVRPDKDIVIKQDLPGLMVNPSVGSPEVIPDSSLQVGKTAKIGIDATKPLDELGRFARIDTPSEVKQRILKLIEKNKKPKQRAIN